MKEPKNLLKGLIGALKNQISNCFRKPKDQTPISIPWVMEAVNAHDTFSADLETSRFSEKTRKILEEHAYLDMLRVAKNDGAYLTYRERLSVAYGFRVTNNYLRMHGGIMERKGGRHGRKKKTVCI